MSKFYFVRDSIGQCWVNLDHIIYVNAESDKLILKMSNNSSFLVDGEDVTALSQILWNDTLNWDEEFKDNDKRHNHEDIPSLEEVMQDERFDHDWECSEDEYSDLKREDEGNEDFPYSVGICLEK